MVKNIAFIVAGLSIAVLSDAPAGDDQPTSQEMVGEARSLASKAYHGDESALSFLRTHASTNDAGAEYGLGEYCVLIKDYAQSVSWFQKSSDQNFVGGFYGLAIAYDAGLGVAQDYAKAMHFYSKATELADAKFKIGRLYARGHGVQQEFSQAIIWYKKAAEAGSLEADLALGSLYQMGSDVPQDEIQAMQWFRKAADLRNPLAEYRVALLYEHSASFHDYGQSAYWYQRAAQQGVAEAQLNLGILYSSGRGVIADAARAVQLFQMAANQGNGQAQYRLASNFLTGAGVRRDPVRAYEWFTIAAASLDQNDSTYSEALAKVKGLEHEVSAGQLSRAKKSAEEWLKKHSAINRYPEASF